MQYISERGKPGVSESVYILICQTGTFVARTIKFFTKKPYNHSSISCDVHLNDMYSFCRNQPKRPLPATFNQEIVGSGTLRYFSNIPCELYEIPVTREQYQSIQNTLEHFKRNRQEYSYNILGMFPILFHICIPRSSKFVCSQFVAHVLAESGVDLPKSVWLCSPEDLRHLPQAKLIYRGELNAYYQSQQQILQMQQS